ncbi:MAG TPA: hypothetical protein VJ932_06365 [Alkalispirochaeta sp.]|nr:hypothetical protein [Alkalispirochaeta sp.]
MRQQLVILLTSLFFLLSSPLSPAQEQDVPSGSNSEPASEAEPEQPQGSLFEQTLLSDLDTAPTTELLDWSRSLGLSTRGSRRAIENRIIEYYGLDRNTLEDRAGATQEAAAPPDAGSEDTSEPSLLRIEEARGSDFFSLEETDEEYLRLTGGVVLTLDDGTTVHRIEAQEIVVNLSENLLSASGGVQYTTEQAGGTEQFRGERIVFRIDSWEGVFIHGITEARDSQADGSQGDDAVDFSVQGERITRSAEEIIVVDGGTITSSQADPPNYEIRARRIWILAPGEWGLRNAVLYVGRVPMFYLPAFFLPGDRLFFHPALGTRTREGQFIQTTTYLLGESDERDPPISIMRLADDGSSEDRVIEGLFLRIPDEPTPPRPAGWNLKVMLDAYTTLGAYAGIDAVLPELGPLDRFNGRFGIGASRNIFLEDGTYSSWYIDSQGQAQQYWNTGWFLGTRLPFRYEAELDTSSEIGTLSLSLQMLLLSDPQFRRDFGDRSEAIDWGVFLNSGSAQDETTGSTVSSTTWEAALRWSPSVPDSLRPWVTSFSIRSLRAQVDWRTRNEENLPDPLTLSISDNSPEERFLYPESMVVPDLAGELAGTLFQYPRRHGESSENEDDEPQEDDSPRLRPPWEGSQDEDADQEERYRLPEIAPNAPGIPSDGDGTVAVQYRITPNLRLDRFTDDRDWESGSDVGFDPWYSTFQTRNRAELTSSAQDANSYLSFRNSLTLEHRYQDVTIVAATDEEERERLQRSAFQYRGTLLTQRTSLTANPLRDVDPLEDSSLQYQLNSLAYAREFVEVDTDGNPRYETRWGQWTRDDISTHRTQARFVWSPGSAVQRFTATSDLPPRLRTYLGNVSLETGPLTSEFSAGYRETEEGWEPDTIVQNHQLLLFRRNLTIGQRLEYDIEAVRVEQARSSVSAYGVDTTLVGRHTTGFTFEPGSGWTGNDAETFRWTSATVGIGVDEELYTWKRRVGLSVTGAADVDIDLQRFTNSSVLLTYGFAVDIYRFLELEVSARTRNDLVYQYVPSLAEEVGRPHRSFFTDLVDSLRIFNRDRRETALFKLDTLDVAAVHDMEDWELRLRYTGGPELDTDAQLPTYQWRGVLSVVLRWRPIPELRRAIEVEDGDVEFDQ